MLVFSLRQSSAMICLPCIKRSQLTFGISAVNLKVPLEVSPHQFENDEAARWKGRLWQICQLQQPSQNAGAEVGAHGRERVQGAFDPLRDEAIAIVEDGG